MNPQREPRGMFDIRGVLVSIDVAERYFCCDLDACRGACCVKGDAGAPVTQAEADAIDAVLPEISADMVQRAVEAVKTEGSSYLDPEGERVTQLLDGGPCVFCHYASDGLCLCAVEKARREGRTAVDKPISCALYPVRVTERPGFTAVNAHRWKICRPAERLGRERGIRLFEFLEGPLVRRFGRPWYDELALTCREYLRQFPTQ